MSFDTEALHTAVPFSRILGIQLVEATVDLVEVRMSWREDLCTGAGTLHGGALMSLADTAGAVSATLNLPEGSAGTTTIESKTNLLAPVRSGEVRAVARPLRAGRTMIVVETELWNEDRLVAKTTQTQAVLR